MTSVFGTDSAYYGLANDHLYLNITGNDIVKETKTCYSSLIQKGASDEDITAYTDKYNSRWNPSIFAAIQQYDSDCKNNFEKAFKPISKSVKSTTIYSVLSEIPTLSECLKYINASSYFDILNKSTTKKTFFAFENPGSDIASLFLQKYNYQVYAIREFLKANTLDYPVPPTQLVKRKVQLTTLSKSNPIYADGRGKQLVIYIPNSDFKHYSFGKQEITILIKGYIETDNGWLYILEAPIVPQIFI
jgi:hypothetical protein